MKIFAFFALVLVAEARNIQLKPNLIGHRIIGGTPATIEEFPSHASLRYSGTHTCGSVHLSASTQLTAAHCVDGRTAVGFELYYRSANRVAHGIMAPVSAYKMHELYGQPDGGNGFPYDIATVTAYVSFDGVTAVAANLPSGNSDFAGEICTITGWGNTGLTEEFPRELQMVNNTVITNTDCHDRMSSVPDSGIAPYHICMFDSENQNYAACNGDSGGPMYCEEDGVNVVAGVASWTISNLFECNTAFPSVYTRVSYFLDWLP